MTTTQLHLFNAFYLVLLAIVAILTRATPRRIMGAMAGGAAIGLLSLVIIPIGERAGWWHFALSWEPYFLTLMEIDSALTGFVFLITWRIARRFRSCSLLLPEARPARKVFRYSCNSRSVVRVFYVDFPEPGQLPLLAAHH